MENTNYRRNWESHTGMKIPQGMHLHHINGDTDDNTVDNLALVTKEGHARCHEELEDTGAANLIRGWTESVDNGYVLSEVVETFPTESWENRYSKFSHFPAKILSAERNKDRGYVSYEVVCESTSEIHKGKMYDKFCKMHGQRQPDKGEHVNMMLSFEKASKRVYLGLSTLSKEYIG